MPASIRAGRPSNTDATALQLGGHPIKNVVADDSSFVVHLGNAGRPHAVASRPISSLHRSSGWSRSFVFASLRALHLDHRLRSGAFRKEGLDSAAHTGNAGRGSRPTAPGQDLRRQHSLYGVARNVAGVAGWHPRQSPAIVLCFTEATSGNAATALLQRASRSAFRQLRVHQLYHHRLARRCSVEVERAVRRTSIRLWYRERVEMKEYVVWCLVSPYALTFAVHMINRGSSANEMALRISISVGTLRSLPCAKSLRTFRVCNNRLNSASVYGIPSAVRQYRSRLSSGASFRLPRTSRIRSFFLPSNPSKACSRNLVQLRLG